MILFYGVPVLWAHVVYKIMHLKLVKMLKIQSIILTIELIMSW